MFGQRLKQLREAANLTQEELAKIINVSNRTISAYEKSIADPSTETLSKLADYFNVSVDYLLGKERKGFNVSGIYPVSEFISIPVYGEIRAGEPMFVREEVIGWEYVSANQIKHGEYFYLRVKGDSMIEEDIKEGDYVLIKRQAALEDGDIGVISIIGESTDEYGSEATIKKFYRKGNLAVLQSANSKYAPIIVPLRDVRIIGKAIKVEHWLNGRHF